MNPLANILPPRWRRRAYACYGVVVLLVGAAQVAFASVEAAQPKALTAALAVCAYAGAALGFTAASNTAEPLEELGDLEEPPLD